AVLFARSPAGPNVILVSLDTLRADFLGCYGETRDTSPAIDRFARSSVLFENAYSQAPNTLLSHGSLLTSRYPSVNMASAEGNKVPKWRIFAAEILREAGYRTLGIVDSHFLTKTYGLEQGYDRYIRRGDGAKRIVAKARSWLDRYSDEPFFLFVHIYDIHSPYARTAPYKRRFVEKPYDGPVTSNSMELVKYQRQVRRGETPDLAIDEAAAEYLRALYAGGVRETDDAIAPFLQYIEESALGENTIVVLTSDHGEEFLEHGTVLHAELYRTVTHVPLIVRLPGGERGGKRVPQAVGLVDVLPTLLDVTGVETPGKMSGHSLAGLMRGDETEAFRRFSFSEMSDDLGSVATLNDRFHLVGKTGEGRWELFEYRNDRLEQEDLFANHPETADSLTRLITLWRREIEADIAAEAGRTTEAVELDEATVRELKAFGYLD
ncbi:MAG: sulfatase, partial [Gemmatimonadetes bacterium]|nr:sulfatase [Gemmatimonadota bacterium]